MHIVETDTRQAVQSTCPVCSKLFLTTAELIDRRPLVACVNGDTICADCYNEHRKRPDGKCPTCGDDLQPTLIVNKALTEMIDNCATKLEIALEDIDMNKEPFAEGGSAKVYTGKWRNNDVVVKVMKCISEKERQAFKSEANLTLRMKHTNVIKLFGITCVKETKLGLVMEKALHGSLEKWIEEVDYEETRQMALGIIDGLKYVHSQHVIHRDIKPQNILMFGEKGDMVPKIADFGVSKTIQTNKMTHTRVGTDFYFAPEIHQHLHYSFPADIYSLAVMLFEMFNKQLLEQAPAEIRVMLSDVRALKKVPASCKVPVYLRDVIERGWLEKPDDRPSLDEYFSAIRG